MRKYSRLGWYRRCGMNVVIFIISKDLLENRIKDRAGLLNPPILLLSKSWNIYYITPEFIVLRWLKVYGWRYVVRLIGKFNC